MIYNEYKTGKNKNQTGLRNFQPRKKILTAKCESAINNMETMKKKIVLTALDKATVNEM